MICSVCENPMVVLELDQIEIDHCLHCGGIWLDKGELEEVIKLSSENKEGKIIKLLTQMFKSKLSANKNGGSK